MTALSVQNLTLSAQRVVLVKDVSFAIARGEIMALVGESGSGKTLTALSVMGLLPEAIRKSGTVTPDYAKSRGLKTGMIFQEPMTSLNPLHTLGKQIGEAIRIHHGELGKSAVRMRVLALLDKVGLGHFKDRLGSYPHQLSGGERQRVMIAMAIANDPELLIADEPTTALDVTIQAQILALIQELRAKSGMAVLLITHDLSLVRRVADRVAIMSQGEIVEEGATAEIFRKPEHPYTKKLLASEPGNAPALAECKAEMLVECRGLSVAYFTSRGMLSWRKTTHPILTGINLGVSIGETLGVVGESGSGKTSLALALLRLIPSTGVIRFNGMPIESLSKGEIRPLRRSMQIVFQDPFSSLNPRMPVEAIVREGLDLHEPNLAEAEKQARLGAILQEVGLSPDARVRYPHEFSGGQRQRISIARALILNPKFLILDEPTSALDLSVQAQILGLLRNLQKKYGLTYIFISHDLRVVRAISHCILVLKKGHVVEYGEVNQVFDNPKAEYTRALIKAAML